MAAKIVASAISLLGLQVIGALRGRAKSFAAAARPAKKSRHQKLTYDPGGASQKQSGRYWGRRSGGRRIGYAVAGASAVRASCALNPPAKRLAPAVIFSTPLGAE